MKAVITHIMRRVRLDSPLVMGKEMRFRSLSVLQLCTGP